MGSKDCGKYWIFFHCWSIKKEKTIIRLDEISFQVIIIIIIVWKVNSGLNVMKVQKLIAPSSIWSSSAAEHGFLPQKCKAVRSDAVGIIQSGVHCWISIKVTRALTHVHLAVSGLIILKKNEGGNHTKRPHDFCTCAAPAQMRSFAARRWEEM